MRRLRRLTNQIMANPSSKGISHKPILSSQSHNLSTQNAANEEKEDKSVLIEEVSGNYLVTLNRTKALNSLNTDMIHILTPFYQKLIADRKQCTVVMRGAGDKAFCAGGDVRKIYDLGKSGAKMEEIMEFFKLEYILDNLLGTLPEYVHNVCLLNGITMGGGVGLSVHGRYRVATNKTLFAMPETGIGFYTDVGGSYFLPRLVPKGLGLYLALNGYRLKGADVLHSGVATHFVEENQMDSLIEDLLYQTQEYAPGVSAAAVLSKYSVHSSKLPDFSLKNDLDHIEGIFDYSKSIEQIMEELKALGDNKWATNTLKSMGAVSPTSLKVVHRALYEGRNMDLRRCLDMELDIVEEFMRGHDFYEGIRAQLVDKDRNPIWDPVELSKVGSVDAYFPNL